MALANVEIEQQDETAVQVEETVTTVDEETTTTFHEVLKKQFIDGGWGFMSIILVVLVFGLAVCIERIIYLTLSTTNTKNCLHNLKKL